MNCLVTGGAGFIGSHLVNKLLLDGHYVICIDNFDPYYDPNLKRKNINPYLENENFKLLEKDFSDRNLLRQVFREESIECVLHNAAQAGVRVSIENPEKTNTVNATGTLNLLIEAKDAGVKRVVNSSSSSVYGLTPTPFSESSTNIPISPYGVSKLAAEHYCRVFGELYGLKTISLRYFTVYGPRMRPDLAINIFSHAAFENKPINIFGDGNKSRDFTFISDIVNANMLALKKANNSVYNIGYGQSISINELAEKIISLTNSSSKIIHTESIKGDAEHTLADVSRIRNEFGWKPEVNINKGLERYIEWLKN